MLTLHDLISTRHVPVVLLAALLIGGCNRNVSPASDDPHTTPPAVAPAAQLPAEVQQAPPVVREAYEYAVANPEALQQVGCHCGCAGMGHTSVYSCFVASRDSNGVTRFDGHALGCSICVDIARDVKRLAAEGRNIGDIRAYIETEYSRYGPSNLSQ